MAEYDILDMVSEALSAADVSHDYYPATPTSQAEIIIFKRSKQWRILSHELAQPDRSYPRAKRLT